MTLHSVANLSLLPAPICPVRQLLSVPSDLTCFPHKCSILVLLCSFRFPMDTALYSAIHLEDSLMEGKSFFLQEDANCSRELEAGKGVLAVFPGWTSCSRGRNTVERIAIAKADAVCFGCTRTVLCLLPLTMSNWLPYLRTNMNCFIFVSVLPTIHCLLIIS